jgi:hypothetical protein
VIALLLGLLLNATRPTPNGQPEPGEPEPARPDLDLDDGYATTAACDALDTWWEQQYGGVATRGERQ